MTYLFIVLALGFSALMLFQLFRPFLVSRTEQLHFELLDEDLRQIEALMAKKAALVQTLRDLEYDHETAKISAEDYKRFRRSCERQAVGIMRRLDAIHGGKDWRLEIERSLQTPSDESTSTPNVDPQESSASLTPDKSTASTQTSPNPDLLTCQQCDTPLKADDKFCSQCGTPVAASDDSPDDLKDTSPADTPVPSNTSVQSSPAALSR